MGRWKVVDIWDPEQDPAQRRVRDALEARPPEAPPAPDPVVVAPLDVAEEIEVLTARIRSGDRSVIARLRHLLGR